MANKIIVGHDGSGSGQRAVDYATGMAKLIGDCELVLVYVIEWSPFSFQTAEENEQRHKRREEEIGLAMTRVLNPAIEALEKTGVPARGLVKHGDVADLLEAVAKDEGAIQIVVARSSEHGIASRLFGSATANLAMHASVPVTIIA